MVSDSSWVAFWMRFISLKKTKTNTNPAIVVALVPFKTRFKKQNAKQKSPVKRLHSGRPCDAATLAGNACGDQGDAVETRGAAVG